MQIQNPEMKKVKSGTKLSIPNMNNMNNTSNMNSNLAGYKSKANDEIYEIYFKIKKGNKKKI